MPEAVTHAMTPITICAVVFEDRVSSASASAATTVHQGLRLTYPHACRHLISRNRLQLLPTCNLVANGRDRIIADAQGHARLPRQARECPDAVRVEAHVAGLRLVIDALDCRDMLGQG